MTLDRRQALARLSDDHELFAEICRMYETDAPEVVRKLKKALLAEDEKRALQYSHTLKSISATIGANSLKNVALQAELLAKEAKLPEIRRLLGRIDTLLAEVLEEIG